MPRQIKIVPLVCLLLGTLFTGILTPLAWADGWAEADKLVPAAIHGDDHFGGAVAVSGDFAMVGAWGYLGRKGAVFAYERVDGVWIERQQLLASDGGGGDNFGLAVAMSGTRAIVGAPWDHDEEGTAYIFEYSGGVWSETAILHASDPGEGDRFGGGLSIHGDFAVVGGYRNHNDQGVVYVFHYDGVGWSEVATLYDEEGAFFDFFGLHVAMSDTTLMVGVSRDDDDEGTKNTGSVFLYENVGGVWTERPKFRPLDAAEGDAFGASVAISGNRAAIGAPGVGDSGGAVYVYTRESGTWTQTAKLLPTVGGQQGTMGSSVAINGDIVIAGALTDDAVWENSGAANVFEYFDGQWQHTARLTPSDPNNQSRFGQGVGTDGSSLIVGMPSDNDHGQGSGSLVVYERADLTLLSAESCMYHGQALLCQDIIDHFIEPRQAGLVRLKLAVNENLAADTVNNSSVQLNCASLVPDDLSVGLSGTSTVRVQFSFDPDFASECCRISFVGLSSVSGALLAPIDITSLPGDMDFSGNVTGGDPLLIKPHLGEFASSLDPRWDFDRNGVVTGSDFALIKPILGNAAQPCP